MKRSHGLRVLMLGVIAALSGCASIVSGNKSTTYIETDPKKARCELDGKDFKRVVQTPTSIHLSATAAPIKVTCTADGYHAATTEMNTSSDGMILGNILFGGVIGVVVDAASQSGMKFPERVTLALDPKGFATAEARDAWYARRRDLIQRQWMDKFLASSQSVDCDTDSEAAKRKCFDNYASVEFKAGREEALSEIRKKYESSEIDVAFSTKSAGEEPVQSVESEPRKIRADIERGWRNRIEAIKSDGPYKDCELAVDSVSSDPTGFTNCRERGQQIARLQKQMERELAAEQQPAAALAAPPPAGVVKAAKPLLSEVPQGAKPDVPRDAKRMQIESDTVRLEKPARPDSETPQLDVATAIPLPPDSKINFAKDREAIEVAISDYYFNGGYSNDILESEHDDFYGMQMDRIRDVSVQKIAGNRIDVLAEYSASSNSTVGSIGLRRKSRFLLKKENGAFTVIKMWGARVA